jgi:hypothetical protein
MKLLSIDTNAKTSKNTQYGYLTGILYLAPFDLSGVNYCPMAKLAGCVDGCLYSAGRGAFSNVQAARLNRSKLFNNDQNAFMRQLVDEIGALSYKAKKLGLKAAVRLNGTSDIRWENIQFKWFNKLQTIFEIFPDVQFYDYTKIPNRKNIPSNYDLTFSYSGKKGFEKYNQKAIDNGVRIAAVFDKPENIPVTFHKRNVLDGDKHDLTFLNPKNAILGLYAKGKARKDTSGFVIQSR